MGKRERKNWKDMMICPLKFMVEMVNTKLLQSGFTEFGCVQNHNKGMTAAAKRKALCFYNIIDQVFTICYRRH